MTIDHNRGKHTSLNYKQVNTSSSDLWAHFDKCEKAAITNRGTHLLARPKDKIRFNKIAIQPKRQVDNDAIGLSRGQRLFI